MPEREVLPRQGNVLELGGGLEARLYPNGLELWTHNIFLCGFTPAEWKRVSDWVPKELQRIADSQEGPYVAP